MIPAGLAAYRSATAILSPLAPSLLRRRVSRGKEDGARMAERLGHPDQPRPAGPLLWLHGASVGESLALLPIVERARATRPDATILVTAGTVTANALLAKRLPPGVLSQFSPIDTPGAARGFLDHWRPGLGLLVESELWPNLLLEAKRRQIRLGLLSAKMSEASHRRWRLARRSAGTLLGTFDLVLARDEAQAARLRDLGAKVGGVFDVKFGADPLPDVFTDVAHDAGAPMILAASTHPGEDEIVLDAFRRALGTGDAVRLVIAPRHPERAPAIVALARSKGFDASLQSTGGATHRRVLVADRMGELGGWYRRAALAIIGGSLRPAVGGHNPLEPARLGCPVLAGPHHEGWPIYDDMDRAGAVKIVDPDCLADEIGRLWSQPESLKRMAEFARIFVKERDSAAVHAIDRALDLLER